MVLLRRNGVLLARVASLVKEILITMVVLQVCTRGPSRLARTREAHLIVEDWTRK